jgi:hypothetical protein
MRDFVMEDLPIKPAMCTEYEELLRRSYIALIDWSNGRDAIRRSGLRGREADNALRNLQARFAKAYAALERHGHQCDVCRIASLINSSYASSLAASGQPLYH